MAPRVAGLDLSITATGVVDAAGLPFTIRPKATGDARLPEIRNLLVDVIADADLVIIEDLPTHAHGAGITGMVHGAVRLACYDHAVTYTLIPPATLKKYATGRGNATKADMRMALYQRTGMDLRDDNQVDAAWLRYAGLDLLDHPHLQMPASHREALAKIPRPEVTP